ncbi:hypothetical protein EYE40_13980 [Glaciihabitans arcticus]|uniref:Nucleotidyltransferase family protein n=1 Tax=Glaciihabitans arcticus TaxID=2668039 RepID=A0A4Q9GTP3_9MICO|nr:hypothetical protein [Glaciihabitans arcticus]TBN58412.1 hypothetical protein EYE40_13980 [Glaciihabitans arcticus]
MGRRSESDGSARGVALRASKDRLLALVALETAQAGIRAVAGGGSVFPVHGLISPRVSRAVSVIVAPSDLSAFVRVLRARGWVLEQPRRGLALLPRATLGLTHVGWPCSLRVHSVIPGFFTDPRHAFDELWERRTFMTLHGIEVPVLDKITTVMFAAHDRLTGDRIRPSADSNLEYFLGQFREALDPAECRSLLELVQRVGGGEELRPLLEGLGLDPGETVLPDDEYTRWRLGLHRVTQADCCLLAFIELPPAKRPELVRAKMPRTLGGMIGAYGAGVASLVRLRGAGRRLAALLPESSRSG